ncbi:MAG: glycosyltransferase [Clostridia bacterium]|nr:glycosyltransferase [Clostridia bacterium]
MAKIKLAYVTHGLSSNGIESLLVNIVSHIDMSKYEVTFIVAIDKDVVPLHEETVRTLGSDIIKICDLDTLKKKGEYIKSLEQVFKDGQFDIVHANMDLLNGIVLRAAKKAGIKKRICHAHNSSSQYALTGDKSFVFRLAQKIYQFIMKGLILQNSTCLLGCSDKANAYMYGKKSKKAFVINNGIFLDRFSEILSDEVRGMTSKKDIINIISVGRLSPQKNPMFIIDIIEELSHLRKDFMFNWVGDGEMRDEIRSKIEEKGISEYFNLMGVRTDIPQILHNCSYFLMPSVFEGLPVSLVEAQASALECFVSSVITNEVDLGACHFIPLDIGAKEWAKIINETINKNQPLKADPEKLMKFDISYTVKQLDEVYSK